MSLTAVYKTTDGEIFTSRRDANKHEAKLDTIKAIDDLLSANIPTLGGDSRTVAVLLVDSAPLFLQTLRQLKPQPLMDTAVLSELGLVAPSKDAETDAEATKETAGTPEEGESDSDATAPDETAAEPVQTEAPDEPAAEPAPETAAAEEPAPENLGSPPAPAEPQATEESAPAPGSFF